MKLTIVGLHFFAQKVRVESCLAVVLVQIHKLSYFVKEENNLILAKDLFALDDVLVHVFLASHFFGLLEDTNVVLEGEPMAKGAAIKQEHGEFRKLKDIRFGFAKV